MSNDLREGQVLRVTKAYDGPPGHKLNSNQVVGECAWALVTRDRGDQTCWVEWLDQELDAVVPYLAPYDVFEVIPESKWPDEVCVMLAKRALL